MSVCDEWYDYAKFREWAIANGYEENLTIDRIDPNGDYTPTNCRWVTMSENVSHSNRTSQHRHADRGDYYGVSPDGVMYIFENDNKFAFENGLNASIVRKHARKGTRTLSGWSFGYTKDLTVEPQTTIENTQ